MRSRLFVMALFCFPIVFASPAHADITLCNRTSYVLETATAAAEGKDALSHGWTRITPGKCEVTLKGDLKPIRYYVYAKTSLAHAGAARAWGGNVPICVQDTDFSLRSPPGNATCPGDAGYRRPFSMIDPKGAQNWVVTLNESAALKTLEEAQLAGVKRLLRDNGFKITSIDARPDKQTQGALDAFRARIRFAPGATNDDLFDALETEAMKTTAPAGYTVCNDSSGTLTAAMAEKKANEFASHGWWIIAPNSCSHLSNAALATDKVFLFVRKDGHVLVSGAAKFCTTESEFDIRGNVGCAGRGYMEMGFAETDTKGKTGFVAHIGDEGLLPPLAVAATASK